MQPIKYAQTAWNDIKNSPGWMAKIALLALLQFIPVFGQIVLLGYAFGWARDIAWGIHSPMPEKILGNEDGKLYTRGLFLLVILLVFMLAVSFVSGIGGGVSSLGAGSDVLGSINLLPQAFIGVGGLFDLVSLVLSAAIALFFGISAMRTSIYDRISAGFQFKKIWAMFRYDTNGALRITGMTFLFGFAFAFLFGIVLSIVAIPFVWFAGMTLVDVGNAADSSQFILSLLPSLGIGMLVSLPIMFLASFTTAFLNVMVARAWGYWTQQFQVAQWRGQDDPMPFEEAAAYQAAQQAQYAAQVQYTQAQAAYAQAQGQQINYQHQQAQQAYQTAVATAAAQAAAGSVPASQAAPAAVPQDAAEVPVALQPQTVEEAVVETKAPAPEADAIPAAAAQPVADVAPAVVSAQPVAAQPEASVFEEAEPIVASQVSPEEEAPIDEGGEGRTEV